MMFVPRPASGTTLPHTAFSTGGTWNASSLIRDKLYHQTGNGALTYISDQSHIYIMKQQEPLSGRQLGRPIDREARLARAGQMRDAARRCFARKGFHAASTAEISAEAGVSVANLFQYFPTKDDLVMALIEDHLQADLGVIQMLAGADNLAEGLKAAGAWIANADVRDEQHPIRLDILAETFRRKDVAQVACRAENEMISALAVAIEDAKGRGEVTDNVDARESAALIVAFTDGVLSRIAVSPLSSKDVAAAFVDFIGRALGLAQSTGRAFHPRKR